MMGIVSWAVRLLFVALQLWDSHQQHATSSFRKSALHIIPTGQHRHFSPGSVRFGDSEAAVLLLWRGKQIDDWESIWQQIQNRRINQETAQQKHDRRKIPLFLSFPFLFAWLPGSGTAVTSHAFQVGKEDVSFQHSQQICTTHVSLTSGRTADWLLSDALDFLCTSHTVGPICPGGIELNLQLICTRTASPMHSRYTFCWAREVNAICVCTINACGENL